MSNTFKVNGKQVSRKEAKAMMDDDTTIVNQFSVGFKNEAAKDAELTHEGFQIDKTFMSQASKAMTKTESSRIIMSFKKSAKVMGRNVYIIVANQDDEINEIIENLK